MCVRACGCLETVREEIATVCRQAVLFVTVTLAAVALVTGVRNVCVRAAAIGDDRSDSGDEAAVVGCPSRRRSKKEQTLNNGPCHTMAEGACLACLSCWCTRLVYTRIYVYTRTV